METQDTVDVINETVPKNSSIEPNENSQKMCENSEISFELNNVEINNSLKENIEIKSHEKCVDLNCDDVQNESVSNAPEIVQENSKQTTRFSIRQQKSRENSPTKISPPLNKIKNQKKSLPKKKKIARKRKLNENLTEEDMNDVIEKLKATKIRNKQGNSTKLKRSTVNEKREKPETEIVKPKKNTRITKNAILPRVKKLNKSKKLMHIKTGKKKLLKVTKTEQDAPKRRGRPMKRVTDATSFASKRKKPNETSEEIDKVEEQLNVLFFGGEESTTIELTDENFQKVDPLTLTASPKPKRTYLGPKSKAKNTTPNKQTQKTPIPPKKEEEGEEEDTKPTTRRVYPAKRKRASSDVFNSVKNDAQLMLNHGENIKNDSGDEMENTIALDDDSDAESREEWMPEDYAEYKYRFSMKKLKKTKEFTCKICLKVFQSYYKMKQHQKVHVDKRDPYTCQQCEETFTSVDELTAHLRAHKGKHPYQCKKCEKGFWSKSELEEHTPIHILKKTKQKEKRFRCDVCAKEFSKLCDMERHMRVHTGEKPCVCNICNKRFQQSHNLSKHLLTHLQVRPYHCEICNKKFGRNDVLNRHLLVHSVEKPFMCEYCPKGFIRQQQYTHHMNKVHSGERVPTKDPQPSPQTTETDANV